MRFDIRIGDLEVRSCNQSLCGRDPHETAEIVQWWERHNDRPWCWVLAYWVRGKEGYDLKFVGDRAFEPDVDRKVFWKLAKKGQRRLGKHFAKEQS